MVGGGGLCEAGAGLFDEAAGGVLALGADPIDVRRVDLQHLLDALPLVFALRKDRLALAHRQESVQRDEIELLTLYLVGAAGFLALRLKDLYGGSHIGQRVVCALEIVLVVAPIDIAQAARGTPHLDDIRVVERAVLEIERQPFSLQVVVQNAGIESVAVVGEQVAALDKGHHVGIDGAQAHALLFEHLARDMMYLLRRRGDGVSTRRADVPIPMVHLLEIGGTKLDKRQLNNPIALDIQTGGLRIETNYKFGHESN